MRTPSDIPNTNAGDTNYQYGKLRDDVVPGDGTGTPIRADWQSDLLYGHLEVLDRAGISPNHNAETSQSNQFADAVEKVARDQNTNKQLLSEKGQPLGYASLDAGGKIPTTELPSLAITDTFPVASQVAMLALSAQKGDVAVRSDLNKSFILSAEPASVLGNWVELLTPTDAVQSVNGKTGVITLGSNDIAGLDSAISSKVGLTGDETIYDVKTFDESPIVPTPTTDFQTATKKYVDDNANASPPGLLAEYCGIFAPIGWIFARGQAVDRATYNGLFNVYCPSATAVTTNGSDTLTSTSVDFSEATLGVSIVGLKVEGVGIPAGATITAVTASTITLSANATASASGITIRIFLFGNGNGSTTFNIIDMREASPNGAGTRASGVLAHDARKMGEFAENRGQMHAHAVVSPGVGTYVTTGLAVGAGGTYVPGINVTALDVMRAREFDTYPGYSAPRMGDTTRGNIIGVNYIVKT